MTRLEIPNSELADWYAAGWHYCTSDDHAAIIEWRQNRPAVAPLNCVSHRVPFRTNHEDANERNTGNRT